MIFMNVMTRFVSRKETKDAVNARFKTRIKGRFKWTTMMEVMKMMERYCRVVK